MIATTITPGLLYLVRMHSLAFIVSAENAADALSKGMDVFVTLTGQDVLDYVTRGGTTCTHH